MPCFAIFHTGSTKVAGPNSLLSQSTEALAKIVTSCFLLNKFKEFVITHWEPKCAAAEPSFSSEGPMIAQNFIDFCCDVGDFRKLPKCLFQYFQASHIFQTYIMHGAVKRIPVSICISDEITDTLYRRLDDQEPELFNAALGEAVEFLVMEVLPSYRSQCPSLGETDQNDQVVDRIGINFINLFL